MDTSKLTLGEQIAAASGIALLIVMFLPWYGVDVNVGPLSASESANAWEALSFIDILLFLIAVVAIGVPVAKAMGSLPDDVPGPLVVLAAGGLGVLLVLFRLIDLPTPDISAAGVDFGRKIGIFLGLIATAGIAYGGWRANEESPVATTPASTPPPSPPPPAPEPPAATG
jgi:hypothetical protein